MSKLMLITGGNGFIGKHATKYFREKGLDVISCSRTFYGDGGDCRQCDLSNHDDVKELFRHIKPDYILHLAGTSSPKLDFNAHTIIDNNVKGTFNLLNSCNNGAKIINASSVLVYGEGRFTMPYSENVELKPISIYAATKIATEKLIKVFEHQEKIIGINFRLPAVVGKELTHGMLCDWMKKVINDSALRPIGEFPGPTKPYLYIDDLMSAFNAALTLDSGDYNVAPEDILNVDEVAKIVVNTLNPGLPIEWGTQKTWLGDVNCINVNSDKIRVLSGWENMYSSREAIVKAIS